MTKPTGNPVGRPKTKEYSTLLARVPQDLVDRVKRYASVHRSTIAELIRDGLEWRITEGDPHSAYLYDTNHNGYSSNTDTQTALEGMDLTPNMLDSAEEVDAMPLEPVDIAPQPVLDFDLHKYTLGSPCKAAGHLSHGDRNLRGITSGVCVACADAKKAAKAQRPAPVTKEG